MPLRLVLAEMYVPLKARVELPDGSTDEVEAGRHRFQIDLDAALR